MEQMTNITRLDWDSEFFGIPIGRTEIAASVPVDFADAVRRSPFRLVYAFAPDDLRSPERDAALAAAGGARMDVRTVYRKRLLRKADMPSGVVTARTLTPEMAHLAEASGVWSRFMRDPVLRAHGAAMYRKWIARDFASGAVLILPGDAGPAGLVTVTAGGDVARVGLLAVAPPFRGRGFGRLLVAAAESWSISHGADKCEIATQDANAPARSLYEKCGFSIASRTEVWHFRKDGGVAR